jgi:D-cysteine desulfhydrase family pyridoxal phosphate-dependent enzyme
MLPGHLPRFALAHLPTPLELMPALTARLGGPHVFIKRDDCTGLATGGNKTRKLEFLVGDARAAGADVLVTEGGTQSNHCRQTAAAAAKAGMECVLVLSRARNPDATGNLLLNHILGARVVLVDRGSDRRPMMEHVAQELTAGGRRPYVIPTGGSNGVGALGYVHALHELETQAKALGVSFDAIVFCSGSGGTQGGLTAGAKLLGSRTELIGVSDGEPRHALVDMALRVARETAQVLRVPLSFAPEDIIVYDEYAREGYGIPNAAMVDAVRLLARTEGILLDPVYTGKAMAGLIDLVRRGRFKKGQSVAFIHTGGTPALFAYQDDFAEPAG